jgi:hypothetical protein
MIFIVDESIMNGTVVVGHSITGINANTFDEAKIILKKQGNKMNLKASFDEDDKRIKWIVDNQNEYPYPTYGIMENKELYMIEVD